MLHPNTAASGEEPKVIWWVEQTSQSAFIMNYSMYAGLSSFYISTKQYGAHYPVHYVGNLL